MCVNDLIVQGAKPLFFLDYIAVGKLKLNKMKKILNGIVKGCDTSLCSLIGGETAEMPGIYENEKFDLAGFSVGIVSKKKLLGKKRVKNKNIILAIPSSGVHSNGYSLIRTILKNKKISNKLKSDLLIPTKIYTEEILKLTKNDLINSAALITHQENINKIKKHFSREYMPYEIGFITKDKKKTNVYNKIKW